MNKSPNPNQNKIQFMFAKKCFIKPGMKLKTINAPDDFISGLSLMPEGVVISDSLKAFDQIHWFVTNKAQMESNLNRVMKLMKDGIICWCYFPKGTSKIQADLTRDKGWDKLLEHHEMKWLSLISYNEIWSAFGFRLKNDADIRDELKPKKKEILNYIDAVNKTIRLPEDLITAFNKYPEVAVFFNQLSFSNRKEYVEWIINAKREETRKKRVAGTIERLEKKWKNPGNN